MGKINLGRVLLAGIVAGIVFDVLDFIVDGWLLASRWSDDMAGLGRPEFTSGMIVSFNALGLIGGIALVWLYAAIRPRFGAGPGTAVKAGLAFWFIGFLIPNLGFMWIPHLFTHHLAAMTTAGNLVEVVAAALAGGALYKEAS
jgi:hypothetical protein